MPAERKEVLEPRRQNWRFVVGRVGNTALRPDSSRPEPQVPADIERVIRPTVPTDPNAYETMALRMFINFGRATEHTPLHSALPTEPLDQHEREELIGRVTRSSSIANGFLVMGRILSFAADAYKQYCEETGATPTMAGLRTILKHEDSYNKTAGFLADMPNKLNRLWEEHLCLVGSLYSGVRGGVINYPLLQISGSEGLPHLDIAPIPRRGAVIEAYQLGLEPELGVNCAAKDVYLPKLWNAMSDICCTDPTLFAAELGIEPLPQRRVE